MDREFRNEQVKRANKSAMRATVLLDDLEREYTLEEIAIVTRAGPARLLGLTGKGQLGVGADADVTVYDDKPDREEMFALPRYVVKGGRVVVRDGELVERVDGDAAALAPRRSIPRSRTCSSATGATASASATTRCASRGCSSRRGGSADEGARGRGRRHVRRGVHDVGRPHRGDGRDARLGRAGGPLADRLRHVGDRLQVRGGDRVRAGCLRDSGRPAGRGRAPVRQRPGGPGQAARRADRPDRAHVPDHGVLQRDRGRRGRRRRRAAALLRRRLAGEQGARRRALLADPRDGGRVPRAGALRGGQGRRRRQHHRDGRGRAGDAARHRGGGGRDARGARRGAPVPRRASRAAAARSARATRR